MNRWRLDWTGDTCGPVRVRCTRPRGGLAVAEVVGTSDRKRVCGQELRGRGVGEAEGGRPFGLTQLIRRAVDPGLEKLVGGPVGLSAVHRSLPQHATLARHLVSGRTAKCWGMSCGRPMASGQTDIGQIAPTMRPSRAAVRTGPHRPACIRVWR